MVDSVTPQLVLLPSFTGTPFALDAFLDALGDQPVTQLHLPDHCAQDYDTLAANVFSAMPSGEIVILAESFSAPLAIKLANRLPNIRGLIFANGFLRLSRQAKYPLISHPRLPQKIRGFWQKRGLNKTLFSGLSDELKEALIKAIGEIAPHVYRERCDAVKGLPMTSTQLSIPCLLLQGSKDTLIDPHVMNDLAVFASDIRVVTLPTHHLILQLAPRECANAISAFLQRFNAT